MEKSTQSLKVDPQIWKEVKVHCAKEGITISEFIESLIKEKIKKK